MNTLKMWLRQATAAERDELIARVGMNKGYVYLLANAHRFASAELAGKIAAAAAIIRGRSKETRARLPELLRVDISRDCAACAYALSCLGKDRINAAGFDFVDVKGGSLKGYKRAGPRGRKIGRKG